MTRVELRATLRLELAPLDAFADPRAEEAFAQALAEVNPLDLSKLSPIQLPHQVPGQAQLFRFKGLLKDYFAHV